MYIGFGELAMDIKYFEKSCKGVNEYFPFISEQAKERVLTGIVEKYVQNLEKMTHYQGWSERLRKRAKKSLNLMNKVIEGKTTLEKELAKYELKREQLPTEWFILLGSFDIVPKAQIIDDAIKRLYWKQDKKKI
ncbi:hypothetical protein JW756_02030 [Candidatus Woesearchaeota archaeon]|nr:hypothetical protein [Candidatus Woesearchaeota archaeon]